MELVELLTILYGGGCAGAGNPAGGTGGLLVVFGARIEGAGKVSSSRCKPCK